MCGILAILYFDGRTPRKELVLTMRDAMKHRGPDDAGLYINGPTALAHRRLSIIDLSPAGHQPMTNEDGTIWIVFNGEVYNYLELRPDLEKKGHRFTSSSDTEVMLHQYEEDGEECIHKFNGMFGFVIWDTKSKKLFAARDRLGIKPLYYFASDKKVILASEIKAIIMDPDVPREADNQSILDFCFSGRALDGKSIFKDIHEVEPGYCITVDQRRKSLTIRKYWDIRYNYNYARKITDVESELSCLLDDAVRIHCRSDAPLGCHLSGGIDTSIVAALAAKHRDHLKTFSIKFSNDGYYDETVYARQVAKCVSADYHEGTPSAEDFAHSLAFLLWHMDSPMPTSGGGFAYYAVSSLARRHVTVSLTGHGGDELFAGYPAQFQAAFNSRDMFEFPRALDWESVNKPDPRVRRLLRHLKTYKLSAILGSIRGLFLNGRNDSLEDTWIRLHCNDLAAVRSMFHTDFLRELQGYSPEDVYSRPIITADTDQVLDKCLYHDLKVYLPGLLHLEDRASMAVSLESRVPLLDYRIVEYLATIPVEQKVHQMQPKYLLRKTAAKILPDILLQRKDKRNFPMPANFWLSEEMKKIVDTTLQSPKCRERGIFRKEIMDDARSRFDLGLIWRILNIELWFQIFIDRESEWLESSQCRITPSTINWI